MHVAAIGLQVEDRIADDLAGTVIGDVAAAAGLVHLDAQLGEPLVGGDDVRAAAVALDAERDDGRVLQQEQEIGNRARRAAPRPAPAACASASA